MGAKSRHRQITSDIEDDDVQVEQDEVEDDINETKKTKKRTKAAVAAQESDPDSEPGVADDDEDGVIDVKNFTDHPLSRTELPKLQGLARDWEAMAKKIDQTLQGPIDVAVAAVDASDEKMEKSVIEIERVMKDLIDIQAEMNINHDALDDIYQRVARGEDITKVIDQYDEIFAARKENYDRKTTRQKYAKNEHYRNFKESVWSAKHGEGPMPPITDFIPKENGDESDSDEELEMGGVTQDFKCPLTLRTLDNPLTSKICKHSFSGDALKDMFRNQSTPQRCPATGCNKSFRLSDCVPDKALAKRIRLWERRQKRREEEMDDGEVIE